jgi:glycosyltransferase involved in cell wall biosynthesis
MSRNYAIIHLWPTRGGFRKRMEMLDETLRPIGSVRRIRRFSDLLGWLRSGELRRGRAAAIIYTSLLAPLAVLLRIFRPRCPVYYMVRGDEVTFTSFAGRRFRALVAVCLQKLMAVAGCRFIFASADLRRRFVQRLGRIRHSKVLPNTLGRPLPELRPFDGKVALVGDFGTVKNIEHVIDSLDGGGFRVDLYGNSTLPARWRRAWLHAHGKVGNLVDCLRDSSLVVLAGLDEGIPNVLVESVQAGCGVVTHSAFPFSRLPLSKPWRFELSARRDGDGSRQGGDLRSVLSRLLTEHRDFKRDNPRLVRLIESDWSARVRTIFA